MIKDIEINKIEFKTISRDDLVLSLDRLTRFKHPEKKYYRVFADLLCKYLINPKLSKNCIQELPVQVLKCIVEKVWNESVATNFKTSIKDEKRLQSVLFSESSSCYTLSEEMKQLLDIKLSIIPILDYIRNNRDLPINLKRLVFLLNNDELSVSIRKKYGLRFPVEKVVLCEGITEEILLPQFAKLAGYDFDQNGVKLIGAGGKNQVAKLYCELKDELRIPVFILLDLDARPTADLILPKLRDSDKLYLIHNGEFEDIFSLNLIKRTINTVFKNICECNIADFKQNLPMTKILTEFYRINELGDFQKADFAKAMSETLKYKTDLTDEIMVIISEIEKI